MENHITMVTKFQEMLSIIQNVKLFKKLLDSWLEKSKNNFQNGITAYKKLRNTQENQKKIWRTFPRNAKATIKPELSNCQYGRHTTENNIIIRCYRGVIKPQTFDVNTDFER